MTGALNEFLKIVFLFELVKYRMVLVFYRQKKSDRKITIFEV